MRGSLTRERLLDAGVRVMFRRGYVGSGVREIVAEAGVPQGSFTNHFRSKSQFAGAVLDRYFDHVKSLVEVAMADESLSAGDRLVRYLEIITTQLEADGFTRGCLIGDFSLEAAPIDEELRQRLLSLFEEWLDPFTACIAEAQRSGELSDSFEPRDLADYFLASWQGAILRMKVERTREPLDRFRRVFAATVLNKELPS